jgi:hypothetical protein
VEIRRREEASGKVRVLYGTLGTFLGTQGQGEKKEHHWVTASFLERAPLHIFGSRALLAVGEGSKRPELKHKLAHNTANIDKGERPEK